MAYALTLNEPNLLRLLTWLDLPFMPDLLKTRAEMLAAAARACGTAQFSAANTDAPEPLMGNMMAGHKAAYAEWS